MSVASADIEWVPPCVCQRVEFTNGIVSPHPEVFIYVGTSIMDHWERPRWGRRASYVLNFRRPKFGSASLPVVFSEIGIDHYSRPRRWPFWCRPTCENIASNPQVFSFEIQLLLLELSRVGLDEINILTNWRQVICWIFLRIYRLCRKVLVEGEAGWGGDEMLGRGWKGQLLATLLNAKLLIVNRSELFYQIILNH